MYPLEIACAKTGRRGDKRFWIISLIRDIWIGSMLIILRLNWANASNLSSLLRADGGFFFCRNALTSCQPEGILKDRFFSLSPQLVCLYAETCYFTSFERELYIFLSSG